ncbi:hypothetical protein NQZ68_026878 [Dissostichus eleginoides]|nr:hypothetical protein NQZ68_026878 [Dissostichus eleginoides]
MSVEHLCLRVMFLFASVPAEAHITEKFKDCVRRNRLTLLLHTWLRLCFRFKASFCVAGRLWDRFEQCVLCLPADTSSSLKRQNR